MLQIFPTTQFKMNLNYGFVLDILSLRVYLDWGVCVQL